MKLRLSVILTFCSMLLAAQQKTTLLGLDLRDSETKVIVSWEVEGEEDLVQYNLYRSVDEENYYLVGEIPARNSKIATKYTYDEPTAGGGIIYYKLDLILKNGKQYMLGKAKMDREDKEKAITVIPNREAGNFKLISAEQILPWNLK